MPRYGCIQRINLKLQKYPEGAVEVIKEECLTDVLKHVTNHILSRGLSHIELRLSVSVDTENGVTEIRAESDIKGEGTNA